MNGDWVFQKMYNRTVCFNPLIGLSSNYATIPQRGKKKSQGSFLDSGDTEEVYKQVGWEQTFP